ncbi:MAG: diguanylate cyclase [Steroidobacteraceae bacterium]
MPKDEGARLMALSRLAILDTPPEEVFDRITRLAARALGVPIALVSLVDQTRQWFKSCVGLQVAETAREISFCGHVVFNREGLIVADASIDQRFADNPLVTGEPKIRAYMGVPIFTGDAQPIGTLCVMDTEPRPFDEQDLAVLQDFAAMVEDAIHARELAQSAKQTVQFAQTQEQLFRDSFEQAGVGMVHLSMNGLVLRANQRTCEILGYERGAMHLLSVVDMTHPDDLTRATQSFRDLVAGKVASYRIQKRILRSDGTQLWAELTVTLRHTVSGSADYVIATVEDISAQKHVASDQSAAWKSITALLDQNTRLMREHNATSRGQVEDLIAAESRQRDAERRFRAIADGVPAMISYWNRGLRCEFANAAYREWFKVTPDDAVGMHMRDLMGPTLFALNEPHALATLEGIPQHFERRFVKPDGSYSFVEARYAPDRDEAGNIKGFFTLVTDITTLVSSRLALESSNAKLVRESGTDFLTGLANRREFNDQCEVAAAACAENGTPYSLIVIDLDDFKLINDRFGHDVGDKVLHAIGKVLREGLRGRQDVAARLGGEELAVLCMGALSELDLRATAERIRSRINAESLNTVKGLVQFTASFGVAQSMERDAGWKNVFERADAALYRAKESGKDRVVYGRPVLPGNTGRCKTMKLVARDSKS